MKVLEKIKATTPINIASGFHKYRLEIVCTRCKKTAEVTVHSYESKIDKWEGTCDKCDDK